MNSHTLTKGQDTAVVSARSGKNTFITGPGGVGKTHLIDVLRRSGKTAVTSTTAISAGNIGGVTFNSWAGLGLGLDSVNRMFSKLSGSHRSIIRDTDVLILDEVSMLHPELMDKADELLQKVRFSSAPFGGLQVIALGDFFQLPPVETRRGVETRYAFECDAWKTLDFNVVQLTEIMRQEDEEFQKILNGIRTGDVEGIDFDPLHNCFVNDPAERKGEFTSLSARNKDVDAQNLRRLDKLPGTARTFVSVDKGHDFLVKNSRLPSVLQLKTGALVVYLNNDKPLFNGSIGVVSGFTTGGAPIFRDLATGDEFELQHVKREVFQGYEDVPVTATDRPGVYTTDDGEEWHEDDVHAGRVTRPRVIASRSAFPLRLAWWMTVHKSQGLSLSHVHAHVSNCFADGQLYTALSRARSLKGLTTSEIRSFSVSPKVHNYYHNNV